MGLGSCSSYTGTKYKGGATHHHTISENISLVSSRYPLNDGYFGDKGENSGKRHILSDDPVATARDFYDKIGYGGVETNIPNKNGFISKLKDGSVITWRETSNSDGTPAVDINVKKSTDDGGIKYQKIHFMKNEEE